MTNQQVIDGLKLAIKAVNNTTCITSDEKCNALQSLNLLLREEECKYYRH